MVRNILPKMEKNVCLQIHVLLMFALRLLQDGVITHLEPDILECEVKCALGSITMNKASGGDGIPVELFQILEDDAAKVLHSKGQEIRKTQQWPQDWKSQFSFQSQRKLKLLHNCTHLTH